MSEFGTKIILEIAFQGGRKYVYYVKSILGLQQPANIRHFYLVNKSSYLNAYISKVFLYVKSGHVELEVFVLITRFLRIIVMSLGM